MSIKVYARFLLATFILCLTIAAMAKVFNILINHKGNSYTALLSMRGNQEVHPTVKVNNSEQKVEIIFANGSLTFSIPELIKQLLKIKNSSDEGRLYITENISLELLNVSPN